MKILQQLTLRTGILAPEVDPNGYLAKAAGTTYVHTEENKVYYFEKAEKRWGIKSRHGHGSRR